MGRYTQWNQAKIETSKTSSEVPGVGGTDVESTGRSSASQNSYHEVLASSLQSHDVRMWRELSRQAVLSINHVIISEGSFRFAAFSTMGVRIGSRIISLCGGA